MYLFHEFFVLFSSSVFASSAVNHVPLCFLLPIFGTLSKIQKGGEPVPQPGKRAKRLSPLNSRVKLTNLSVCVVRVVVCTGKFVCKVPMSPPLSVCENRGECTGNNINEYFKENEKVRARSKNYPVIVLCHESLGRC